MPSTTDAKPPGELKRAGRFGIVGIMNTSLDFAMFSGFRLAGVPLVLANVFSASIGMVFSFFANRRFVFSAAGGSVKRQAILFLLATAFSMYVLQTLVIYALSTLFPWTLDAAVAFGQWIGFRSDTAALLIRSNTAKLGATVASTIWNYCFYRWMVFTVTTP